MRFAKVLRFWPHAHTTVGFDVYNLANSATPLTYNQTFMCPTGSRGVESGCGRRGVLHPRYAKFGARARLLV